MTCVCHVLTKSVMKLQGEKDWQKYETARKLKVNSAYCAVTLNLMTHLAAVHEINI